METPNPVQLRTRNGILRPTSFHRKRRTLADRPLPAAFSSESPNCTVSALHHPDSGAQAQEEELPPPAWRPLAGAPSELPVDFTGCWELCWEQLGAVKGAVGR